jgi:hypothetical protein
MFTYNTREKNIEAYGQPQAPAYRLDRVKIKYISLYGGNNDRFVPPLDINVTQTQLGGKCLDLDRTLLIASIV